MTAERDFRSEFLKQLEEMALARPGPGAARRKGGGVPSSPRSTPTCRSTISTGARSSSSTAPASPSGSSRATARPAPPRSGSTRRPGRARLGLAAYRGRDRQRRHAVPGRFGDRRVEPAGPHRAPGGSIPWCGSPATTSGPATDLYEAAAAPSGRILHARRGRTTSRRPNCARRWRGWRRCWPTCALAVADSAGDARPPRGRAPGSTRAPPACPPGGDRRRARLPALARRPTISPLLGYRRYRFEGDGEDARMDIVPRPGPGAAARRRGDRVRRAAQSRHPAARRARLPARAAAAADHQVEPPRRPCTARPSRRASASSCFDDAGTVVGQHLFVGLFTSIATTPEPAPDPGARRQGGGGAGARRLRAGEPRRQGADPHPRDLPARRAVAGHARRSCTPPRSASCACTSASAPRCSCARTRSSASSPAWCSCRATATTTDLRKRIQKILEQRLAGTVTAFQSQFADETVLVRMYFIVKTTRGAIPEFAISEITRRIAEAARGFAERLKEAIVGGSGRTRGWRCSGAMPMPFPPATASVSRPR